MYGRVREMILKSKMLLHIFMMNVVNVKLSPHIQVQINVVAEVGRYVSPKELTYILYHKFILNVPQDLVKTGT